MELILILANAMVQIRLMTGLSIRGLLETNSDWFVGTMCRVSGDRLHFCVR